MPPNTSPMSSETVSASGSSSAGKQSNLFLIIGIAILVILAVTAVGYFMVPAGYQPGSAATGAQAPADTSLGASTYTDVVSQGNPLNSAPTVNPFDTPAPATNPFAEQ